MAKAFKSKGRRRDNIAAHLDLLIDLGMLSRVDTPKAPAGTGPRPWGPEALVSIATGASVRVLIPVVEWE